MMKARFNPLYVLIGIFFFWGFVAASNTVLIAAFKQNFSLTQFQSQLVDSAFYAAYFLGSLAYFLQGRKGNDASQKYGYKRLLTFGLTLSAIGAFGFIPASYLSSFPLMLASLFVVGLGFSIQQIVVNPLLLNLGSDENGARRINLAGGINSLGTTIGPLLVSFVLFGSISSGNNSLKMDDLPIPYTILGFAFLIVAFIVQLSRMPVIAKKEISETVNSFKVDANALWGMLAIFCYVGVEVALQSNLPAYVKSDNVLGLSEANSVHYISLYWGCLMIGRLCASIEVFKLPKALIVPGRFIISAVVYAIIMGVNWLKGSPMIDFLYFAPFVLIFPIIISITSNLPRKSMLALCGLGVLCCILAVTMPGNVGLFAILIGGLCCSILWPCIFALALRDKKGEQAMLSSLLIMMILGGAFLPPLQGYIADISNITIGYTVPMIGFVVLILFAFRNKEITAVAK